MKFYENQFFHIYNQGNNAQTIFFTNEHYKFFLWKMRTYLLPFGDMVCWCLMSTHFHWLFYVKNCTLKRQLYWEHVDKVEMERRYAKFGQNAKPVERNTSRINTDSISINEAIGNLQRSYTRAINKEKNWTGSLFRKPCKAKDGWIDEFVTLKKINGQEDYRFLNGNNYAFQCFVYIHENPVKAGIVLKSIDYTWSSAKDYARLRSGNLCNLELGIQLRDYL